jgi:formamidopyrimidine-DNA glycosylase
MPEGPEVTILSQYLASRITGRQFSKVEVLKGEILNINTINNKNLKVKKTGSKGKLMWIELEGGIYFMSHMGMTGQWSFKKTSKDRVRIKITNSSNDKKYYLCYTDPRNFGNIEIIINSDDFNKKIDLIAMDALRTFFTDADFSNLIDKYLSVSKARSNQKIVVALMKQNKADGIVSGIGNYLAAEILYKSKISPYRIVGSLTNIERKTLAYAIRYVTKLSYYNNTTGYMKNFGSFIEVHRKRIDSRKYANYHTDIVLNSTNKFEFSVYKQKIDPLGNVVKADENVNKDRTTYWVEQVQV